MNTNDELKWQAMSAITNVKTVAHIGMMKMTGGIALYAAHIRQMDKQAPAPRRKIVRDAVGREV
jgi:hypothetical protein